MSDRKSEFTTLISSKITPFLIAFSVLVHCMSLVYSRQAYWTVYESQWPDSLPRSSNMSPHLRGFPFVTGSARSIQGSEYFQESIRYTPPGTFANFSLVLLCTLSTFAVFEFARRRKYKIRLTLASLFTLTTFVAIPTAILSNRATLDDSVLPAVGLMRCISLPNAQYFFFFGLGCICFTLVIASTLTSLLQIFLHGP